MTSMPFASKPLISVKMMAILNLTPDSFSDGGQLNSDAALLKAAEIALQEGSNALDIGGESTRPGAKTIAIEEELRRMVPAIQLILKEFPHVVLSVDTRKSQVAQAALEAGASIINDVSGFQYDPAMAEVCARFGCQVVLMHSQGPPETMQQNPSYPRGVISEIQAFFERQITLALQAGIQRHQLILDPGFGFGKTLQHNLTLLNQLEAFQAFQLPLLVGTSRKSFLTLDHPSDITPTDRDALTAASLAMAVERGAQWVRVHNPALLSPVIRFMEALLNNPTSAEP